MILTFYAIGILALSAFVNWWFLLGLLALAIKLPMLMKRSRVLNVLTAEYQYTFPATAPQAFTLNRMERETRSKNLRDEELATLFMAVMINSLMSDDDEAKAFTGRVAANAARLASAGAISGEVYADFNAVAQQKLGKAV